MSESTKTGLTTRDQLRAEAAKTPVGVRSPEARRLLQSRREMVEVSREIANMSWGKNLGIETCEAIAVYCRRYQIDPASEIEVLGGRLYRNAAYYIRRGVELRDQGLIRDVIVTHINADPRLERLAAGDDEVATRAKNELRAREFARIQHNIPDEAKGAVVVTIVPAEGATVVGANYAGRGLKTRDGRMADPVGENDPGKTAETRAYRRAWRHLISIIPRLAATEDGADDEGKSLSQVVRSEIKANAEPVEAKLIEAGTTVVENDAHSGHVSGVGEASDRVPAAVTPTSGPTDYTGKDAEWALNYLVPIGKSQGRRIDELTLDQIDEGVAWCERKLEKQDSPGIAEFHAALTTALSVKMKQRAAGDSQRPDANEVFRDGSTGPVLPGEVEAHNAASGELALGDAPVRSRDALKEG